MGKKSVDETPDSGERSVDAQDYLTTAEADTHTQPSGLLKALVKALAGTEREAESERERRERSMELRRQWVEHLERERDVNQVGSCLHPILNFLIMSLRAIICYIS